MPKANKLEIIIPEGDYDVYSHALANAEQNLVALRGLGTINGGFIGAAFILLFPFILNAIGNNVFHGAIDATIISSIEQVIFGGLMIIFMIYEPLGMAKLWENIKQKWKTKIPSSTNLKSSLSKKT